MFMRKCYYNSNCLYCKSRHIEALHHRLVDSALHIRRPSDLIYVGKHLQDAHLELKQYPTHNGIQVQCHILNQSCTARTSL